MSASVSKLERHVAQAVVCICEGFDHPINPAQCDPFAVWAIFHFKQWSTTGPSKAMVCAILSVGKCISKTPLLLIGKSRLCCESDMSK